MGYRRESGGTRDDKQGGDSWLVIIHHTVSFTVRDSSEIPRAPFRVNFVCDSDGPQQPVAAVVEEDSSGLRVHRRGAVHQLSELRVGTQGVQPEIM
jgi:hypothetical protein